MRLRLAAFLESHGLPGGWIPDFWLLLTLSIIVACAVVLTLWRRDGWGDGRASDLLFWGILGLFAGSKLFYYLQYGFPSELSGFWRPQGFALYGGLFGLLAAWTICYLARPFPAGRFLDCVAPGLALGLFFGRLGCLMAGCNGGVVSDLPWAMRFPQGAAVYRRQVSAGLLEGWESLSLAVHPTQLYESLFGLAAFFPLLLVFSRYRGTGRVFITGILAYSVYRFFTEYLRGDAGGLHPFGFLTFAQVISILLFLSLTAVLFGRVGAPSGDFDSPPPPLPARPVPPPRKIAAPRSRPRRGHPAPARPDGDRMRRPPIPRG